MNSAEIKNLINKFFELVNKKEYEKLETYLSPNVVFYFPGTKPLNEPKKVLQLFKIIYRRYPNLTFKIKDTIIQEYAYLLSSPKSTNPPIIPPSPFEKGGKGEFLERGRKGDYNYNSSISVNRSR